MRDDAAGVEQRLDVVDLSLVIGIDQVDEFIDPLLENLIGAGHVKGRLGHHVHGGVNEQAQHRPIRTDARVERQVHLAVVFQPGDVFAGIHPHLGEVAADDDRAVPVHVQGIHHAVHAVAGRECGVEFSGGAVEHGNGRAERVAHEQEITADDDASVRHAVHGVDRPVGAFANVKQHVQRPIGVQAGHGVSGLGIDLVEIANDDDLVVELHHDVEHLAVHAQAGIKRLVHRAVVIQPDHATPGLAVECGEPASKHRARNHAGIKAARKILVHIADGDGVNKAVGPHAGLESGIEAAQLADARHPVQSGRVDRGEIPHDINLFLAQRRGGIGRLGLDGNVVHVVVGQRNKIGLAFPCRFIIVYDGDGGPILHPKVCPRLVNLFLHFRVVRVVRVAATPTAVTGIGRLLLILGKILIVRLDIIQDDDEVLVELRHIVIDELDLDEFWSLIICPPVQFACRDMEVAHDIPHIHGKVE